ncbi:MAG: nucleotidyltransferase domain-containing protein [Candidatus Aenigmarchaeota archaeon]|nr:nucleotidyltransferase domain-containing protein [Candidatus Aenigmarchaeota archaeon]
MLEYILDSKEKVRILRLLVNSPSHIFHETEIVRMLKLPQATINRKLRSLAEQNIISRYKKGRTTVYRLNDENYIVRDMLKPLIKAEKNTPLERSNYLCGKLIGHIIGIVFGSAARNEMKPTSDVDLAIITDKTRETERIAFKINQEIFDRDGMIISLHIFNYKDFRKRYRSGDLLIREIANGKVVYGDIEEVL